jgi:hypothetical protein
MTAQLDFMAMLGLPKDDLLGLLRQARCNIDPVCPRSLEIPGLTGQVPKGRITRQTWRRGLS